MQTRNLGKLSVSALGYGSMGLSGIYGAADDKESIQLLRDTHDLGITLFDTADCYGNGHNETLLGKAFSIVRDKVLIATKTAITWDPKTPNKMRVCNQPDYIKNACEEQLKRLQTDYIDLYYIHRIDPNVALEDSIGAMSDLVKQGKVRYIGLSEASAKTIEDAHKIHPLTAVQSELSLWSRDVQYNSILSVCEKLNIGFVPYSPLGRGFLTGKITQGKQFENTDFRKRHPRFRVENAEHNLKLVHSLEAMAEQMQCTAAQLALAWVLAQGENLVPIPGTRNLDRVKENIAALDIKLNNSDLKKLDHYFNSENIHGDRYSPELLKTINI